MRKKQVKKGTKIHFIGVGGVSMSGLALYAKAKGYAVTGSDREQSETVEKVKRAGVAVFMGEGAGLECVYAADEVVYTDAVSLEDKELALAIRLKKRVRKRAEFLGEIVKEFPVSVAVAGSHGKTTCTAMCAHIFHRAGAAFTAFIGGEDTALGGYLKTGEEFTVAEACEYKKNLLKIPAKVRVVLNVDFDHLECYKSGEEVKETFLAFAQGGERAVVCADDPALAKVAGGVSFGIENACADYLAKGLKKEGERYAFTVYEFGKRVGRVKLKVVGRCHIYNALAAIAALRLCGFSWKECKEGVESFTGVKRRFEEIGKLFGALAVCDYAHHPKEIASTLQTAKALFGERLFVVFQPHTYSRTKTLMKEFVEAFSGVERLMIYKTYPAREKFDEEGCAARLAEKIGHCLYSESVAALEAWLRRTVKEGDCVLFLGAGDLYHLAKYLVSGVKK